MLGRAKQPTLILQSSDDALASVSVGRFVEARMPQARLQIVNANGHCLHMTHPDAIAPVIQRFVEAAT